MQNRTVYARKVGSLRLNIDSGLPAMYPGLSD